MSAERIPAADGKPTPAKPKVDPKTAKQIKATFRWLAKTQLQ
jgi:hypothetical protein